jgi:hypothetical protein
MDDVGPETRLFIRSRAKRLARELLTQLASAAQELDKDDHRAVLGDLALAEIQLQHLRAIVRLLAT